MSRIQRVFRGEAITKIMLGIVIVLVGALGAGAVLNIPGIRQDTSASRRTDELASCRGVYRTGVDQAQFRLFDAFGTIQIITADAAVKRQDIYAIPDAIAALVPATEEQLAARQALSDAVKAYDEANTLSRTDPDAFLRSCKDST